MKNDSVILLVAWNVIRLNCGDYGIPFTHYTYLKYVSEMYGKVYLITGVRDSIDKNSLNYHTSDFPNVEMVLLPTVSSFLSAQKNILKYYKALSSLKNNSDIVYCRVPDPFSWMPRLLFHKKTIMHYVGDTIDATKHNEDWSLLKKIIMIAGYLPDYALTLLASKRSKVYTNGHHIKKRLSQFGIKATPVISSTVSVKDLVNPQDKTTGGQLRLIYVGYIRFAKGMNCLMQLWLKLKEKCPNFIFDLVGDGEMFGEVKDFVRNNGLEGNVIMYGHVDNRTRMNEMLRNDDLFIFPSLSEGSPRVVIEAMAAGIPVVSTPVGSLPFCFKDGNSIRYFDFDDSQNACDIICEYLENPGPFLNQRNIAFSLVKDNYTKETFLSKVFSYEE